MIDSFRSMMMDFDPLTKTWERIASARGGKVISEKFDLTLVIDLDRLPLYSLLPKYLGPMDTWGRFVDVYRPVLTIHSNGWDITMRTMGRMIRTEDSFLVSAEATFCSSRVFCLRVREKPAWNSVADKLKDTKLLRDYFNWANSLILKMPLSMALGAETFPNSEPARSGSIEIDHSFSVETTDVAVVQTLLKNWRLREPLLSSEHQIRLVAVKSVPDAESNCVLTDGQVSAKNIEQSTLLLDFIEELLTTLLALGLISPSG